MGGEGLTAAFNIYAAKTSLSKLVEMAAAGGEVIIAKAGKPTQHAHDAGVRAWSALATKSRFLRSAAE